MAGFLQASSSLPSPSRPRHIHLQTSALGQMQASPRATTGCHSGIDQHEYTSEEPQGNPFLLIGQVSTRELYSVWGHAIEA